MQPTSYLCCPVTFHAGACLCVSLRASIHSRLRVALPINWFAPSIQCILLTLPFELIESLSWFSCIQVGFFCSWQLSRTVVFPVDCCRHWEFPLHPLNKRKYYDSRVICVKCSCGDFPPLKWYFQHCIPTAYSVV